MIFLQSQQKFNPFVYADGALGQALAVLMKHGVRTTIMAGRDIHKVDREPRYLEDVCFDYVRIGSYETAVTQYDCDGISPWAAIRTIIQILQTEAPVSMERFTGVQIGPDEDQTFVCFHSQVVERIFDQRHEHFLGLDDKPLARWNRIEVYRGPSTHYYIDGVPVVRDPNGTHMTYNFAGFRVPDKIKNPRTFLSVQIMRSILEAEEEDVIREILTAPQRSAENLWKWSIYAHGVTISETFYKVLVDLYQSRSPRLSYEAGKLYRKHNPAQAPNIIAMSAEQGRKLREAISRLEMFQCGISCRDIDLVECLPHTACVLFIGNRICLTPEALDEDVDELASLILVAYFESLKGKALVDHTNFERWVARRVIDMSNTVS